MKKICFADIVRILPEIEPEFIQNHLNRLDERYFARFTCQEIAKHIKFLTLVTHQKPIQIIVDPLENNLVECTFFTFDYKGLFSILSGLLSGLGFEIISGDIFTYTPMQKNEKNIFHTSYNARKKIALDPIKRRRIIDLFVGRIDNFTAFEQWKIELLEKADKLFPLIESHTQESILTVRQEINNLVSGRISRISKKTAPVLYPIQIIEEPVKGQYTRLKIIGQDTPAFLYSLGYALSQKEIPIEHVHIQTIEKQILDEIDIVNAKQEKITDQNELDQIKFFIMLTKQFTYFIDQAPDPYAALQRFEQLLKDILKMKEQKQWLKLLSNPESLTDLAKLLGASDFLWEDFIRLQYESLIPILKPNFLADHFENWKEKLVLKLNKVISKKKTLEEKKAVLNKFKNKELFSIDLEHILGGFDFKKLSKYLTFLAEIIIQQATFIIYEKLVQKYGIPKTVAGVNAKYTICGLGKFGGKALGYASDIELILIYSDSGKTNGKKSITNEEFFNDFIKEIQLFIQAKRDGIFQIDLRLRPYGDDGPLAVSLETFCNYYFSDPKTLVYEKMALTRLRAISGDKTLGAQVERLRDKHIYNLADLKIEELWDLRKKQFMEKVANGRLNAKFSPGALVDMEYAVQLLQIIYGGKYSKLRVPSVYKALTALGEENILNHEEVNRLTDAYDFFRLLINGLRMLRGSAKDLFLPVVDSLEYSHLARRMGYKREENLQPAQKLHLDFEAYTAVVRDFVERHFSRESLPSFSKCSIADVIFSEKRAVDLQENILKDAGFKNVQRAYTNIKKLAGSGDQKDMFARLAILAMDYLSRQPDPDMALNNWERFCSDKINVLENFKVLIKQPKRLEILMIIFSQSQYLADTLIRFPEYFDWVTNPEKLYKSAIDLKLDRELLDKSKGIDNKTWLKVLRQIKHREILRIGIKDLAMDFSLQNIVQDLSQFTDILVKAVTEREFLNIKKEKQNKMAILAFGKLGAKELNYSSDIDLVAIYEDDEKKLNLEEDLNKILIKITRDLNEYTEDGHCFRVDFRLRPYGISGSLISEQKTFFNYYKNEAALWEIQALIKLRPIAGNLVLGKSFCEKIKTLITKKNTKNVIFNSIKNMREKAKLKYKKQGSDIKNGGGGIRDIEFLAQGLQMVNANKKPDILVQDTIGALQKLGENKFLPLFVVKDLTEHYIFYRRLEHLLQLLEDRQIHNLPLEKEELEILAKRMNFVKVEEFMNSLSNRLGRVRELFEQYISVA